LYNKENKNEVGQQASFFGVLVIVLEVYL